MCNQTILTQQYLQGCYQLLPLLVNMQNAIVYACFLFPHKMVVEHSSSIKTYCIKLRNCNRKLIALL